MSSNSLYAPYRAIGFVTDGNPFIINQLGNENFVALSMGKSFQVMKADRLTTSLVSEQIPCCYSSSVSCFQAIGHETYVGVEKDILVYHRTKIVRTYADLCNGSSVKGMLSIGKILFAYYDSNVVQILDTKARATIGNLDLLEKSDISAMVHPATYLNKILIGYSSGALELWNFRRKALVHSFSSHVKLFQFKKSHYSEMAGDIIDDNESNDEDGEVVPEITCIEQSPVCDVVALGFSSGDIMLVNIKLDEVLFSFKQSDKDNMNENGSAVTSLAFRTDSSAEKFPYLVSGSEDGRLFVWHLGSIEEDRDDLNEKIVSGSRKLMLTIDDAHSEKVAKVQFLHGEPVMISSSPDNSIKMWIFDSPDGSARLLRFREGHKNGGPHRIRFYGGTTNVSMRDNADGYSCEMLSAGADHAFRLFNFAVESQNRELSQKPMLKKLGLNRRNERLPEILAFDCCESRQRDWADIATIHKSHSSAYLWRLKNRVITETILKQPNWKTNAMNHFPDKSTHSSAIALTACGNFCLVGTRGGSVYLYNVQSGLPRGSFPSDAAAPLITEGKASTRVKVPGNVLHERNKILGLSDLKRTGQSWNAGSLSNEPSNDSVVASLVDEKGHEGEVTGLFVDSTMSIVVSSGEDGKLIFWDFVSHKKISSVDNNSPILKLEGFRDGNFVAAVSQDRVIRVYDIMTRKLCRRFDGHSREITDLAFSPDGRRLLSSSVDQTVRVWDMATSRCLSWMEFEAAIESMCLSLSGEYLCISFSEKEGIYMYIDRSLYETVHFWKEPTQPTPVESSPILSDIAPCEDQEANETGTAVSSVQSQVDLGEERETPSQRGIGVITTSAIPKAHWTALLNLEAIKLRNRPVAPPTAPPQAPFFLPTVVKTGDSAPSFPTPMEYKKMTEDLKKKEGEQLLGKRQVESSHDERGETEYPDDDMKELSKMSSAWSDDENDEEQMGGPTVDDEENDSGKLIADNRNKTTSRIIRRRTELPRCKLVAFIEMHFSPGKAYSESPIIQYLKSLGPPAVDAEFRALCRDRQDSVGLELLRKVLVWIADDLGSCENFEVLQAYLYRFLYIYSELILGSPNLYAALQSVKVSHEKSCKKFRHLVQSNLCVLKMLAQIPSF